MSEKRTVVSINLGNFSSTGGIMRAMSAQARSKGYKALCAFPSGSQNYAPDEWAIMLENEFFKKVNGKLSKWSAHNGCFALFSTLRFLKKLKRLRPDILHLHNLHNSYINLPLLFAFIKRHHIRVIWTLHDCWAFTGHCTYFLMENCKKWQNGCHHCPQYSLYPYMSWDNTRRMWSLKKKWFCGVKDLTLVTPSQWLADLARQSFLAAYPVRVIPNGIDLSLFKPTPSDFRAQHGLQGKFVLLGVAFDWGRRKGLDVFAEFARRLDDRFAIVLVGTTEEIERELPDSIIAIRRTQNAAELAAIYTAADLFVNPTREDNFPTVNIEALACGTPVLTFATGGSPESIDDSCGAVVTTDDTSALLREIERIAKDTPFTQEACLARARQFDRNAAYQAYVQLYERGAQ